MKTLCVMNLKGGTGKTVTADNLADLLAADEAGCMIVPPMLTFYNKPADITAQMDHISGKALMPFDLTPSTFHPWEGIT